MMHATCTGRSGEGRGDGTGPRYLRSASPGRKHSDSRSDRFYARRMDSSSPLVLDSLRRRMRAMHSLYHQAVETMDHRPRQPLRARGRAADRVLPVPHHEHDRRIVHADDRHAADLERRVAGAGGMTINDHGKHQHGGRDDPPAHRRLRRLPGVHARRVRPHRGVARPARRRRAGPGRSSPARSRRRSRARTAPAWRARRGSRCSTPPSAGSTSTACATWARSSWPEASSASTA